VARLAPSSHGITKKERKKAKELPNYVFISSPVVIFGLRIFQKYSVLTLRMLLFHLTLFFWDYNISSVHYNMVIYLDFAGCLGRSY
jgi:hypothetical protein